MGEKQLSPNDIILGAGELYLSEFTGDKVPEHAAIETDINNVGHTSGGAEFTYTPSVYDVENSYGKVVKRKITKTECTFKSGILTFDPQKIGLLTNATITEDKAKGFVKITFGADNPLKNVLVRFVHTKDDGKKIRLTMIANATNGFTMTFQGGKETVVDAELSAIEYIKNFLAEIETETGLTLQAITLPTLAVIAKNGGASFTITPSAKATEEKVTGYKWYLKKSTENWEAATVQTGTASGTTGEFNSLQNGTSYDLAVTAVTAQGESEKVVKSFTPAAPTT